MHAVAGVIGTSSAGTEMSCDFIQRWRRTPNETKIARVESEIGETALRERPRPPAGQHQGLHRSPHTQTKTKRAPGTSATQRPQRPLAVTSEKISLLGGFLLAVGVVLAFAGQDLLGDQAGVLADRGFDLVGDVGIGFQKRLGILAALAEPLAVIGEPGAGLFDEAGLDAEVEN